MSRRPAFVFRSRRLGGFTFVPRLLCADANDAVAEVDLLPPQAEDFLDPHAGEDRDCEQRAVPSRRRNQQPSDLGRGERTRLAACPALGQLVRMQAEHRVFADVPLPPARTRAHARGNDSRTDSRRDLTSV
jgi:hypothetical protein